MGLRICISDRFFSGGTPGPRPRSESISCGVMGLPFSVKRAQNPWGFFRLPTGGISPAVTPGTVWWERAGSSRFCMQTCAYSPSGAASLSSVVPWSPESRGCNLSCSENKRQFAAGTVMEQGLAWDGDQSCLFSAFLNAHPRRGDLRVSSGCVWDGVCSGWPSTALSVLHLSQLLLSCLLRIFRSLVTFLVSVSFSFFFFGSFAFPGLSV